MQKANGSESLIDPLYDLICLHVFYSVYNLKRRIAELPPISLQTYTEKAAGRLETSNPKDLGVSRDRKCAHCNETYEDLKLYRRHLKSWRHIQKVEASESGQDPTLFQNDTSLENALLAENQSDSEGESVASIVEHFNPSSCLFCTRNHATLDESLQHMQQDHGMFVPDREHLVDLETFVGYLFTIIAEFNECLYCGHIKSTSHGIRQHMLNKGHCKLRSRDDPEYEEFYDSDADAESLKGKAVRSTDIEKLQNDSDHEVRLDSGRVIGDRAQTPSARLNFRSHAKSAETQLTTTAGIEDSQQQPPEKPLSHDRQLVSRADGGWGMIGVSDLQKRALRAVERKMLTTEIKARNQYRTGVDKAGNMTTQKHWRGRIHPWDHPC